MCKAIAQITISVTTFDSLIFFFGGEDWGRTSDHAFHGVWGNRRMVVKALIGMNTAVWGLLVR